MLLFGHAGITVGTMVLLYGALAKCCSLRTRENKMRECPSPRSQMLPAENRSTRSMISWLGSLANHIDMRLLVIGSLLPDIIDKPIGRFFFRDTFSNGRIFGHTFLFLIVLTCAGLCLYRWHSRMWLLALSFGTCTHLIFDEMWLDPRTLLWPLYGLAFERSNLTSLLPGMLHALHTDPSIYGPEIVGAAILICLALFLGSKKAYTLIRNGRIP